jgi:serine/threonine-protein kinase
MGNVKDGRRLSLQLRLTLVMGIAVAAALVLSIATVLNRQYAAMEQMTLTSGTAISSFVANNVALRAVENAGLAPADQDWLPVQAFVTAASHDAGLRQIVMVDAGGIVRGATDQARVGTHYAAIAGETQLSAEGDQAISAAGDDFRFVRTIRYAGQPFGKVDIVVDGAQLAAAGHSSRNLLVGLGIALLFVVLVISYLIGQSVARPVRRLHRALAEAAAGRRDFRISHRRKDEFGALFDAFNSLAESIEGEPAAAGAAPVSMEATRIGAAPDLGPRLEAMRRRIA